MPVRRGVTFWRTNSAWMAVIYYDAKNILKTIHLRLWIVVLKICIWRITSWRQCWQLRNKHLTVVRNTHLKKFQSIAASLRANAKVTMILFRHARVSSTYPCLSVRWSVRPSHFRITNLSASLVALREKLKREDPNYFCVFTESVFSKSVFF